MSESKIEFVDVQGECDAANELPPLTGEQKRELATEILETSMRRCNGADLAEVLMVVVAGLALGSGLPPELALVLATDNFVTVFQDVIQRLAAYEAVTADGS